jgi:PAS domain S-box-containing protein
MPKKNLSKRSRDAFEKKLRESGLLLELLESMTEGVLITDPRQKDNPAVYANPAFLKLTGYGPETVLGQNCRFLQKDDRDQKGVDDVRKAVQNEESVRVRVRNYKKNGEMFWNELSVSPVHDDDGKLIYFIGIQHDVTAEEKLKRAQEDFVSLVTHQLRTPITTLRLASEMLGEKLTDANDEVKKYFSYIKNSSERMARIVRDILNITKLDSEEDVEIKKEPADIKTIIEMIIRDITPITDKKNVDILVEDQRTNDSQAPMDKDLVYQAVYNLVVNAVQYSHPDTEVNITVDTRENDLIVSVQDHGIGIPKDAQDNIFNRQFRAENAKEHKQKGTGLGLYLTKKIAELHDGDVSFDSREGEGTTFHLTLPNNS